MKKSTHKYVTLLAITEVNSKLLFNKRRRIIRGCTSMDKRYILGIPSIRHFYDPVTGKGVLGQTDAKTRFLRLYRRAVRKKSFFMLGKALHLLQDMSIPAHTQNKPHYLFGDELEKYLRKHQKQIVCNISKLNHSEIGDLFEELAEDTRKMESINSFRNSILYLFGLKKKLPQDELAYQAEHAINSSVSYTIVVLEKFLKALKS